MYYKTLRRNVYLEHYGHMIERMLRRNVEQLSQVPAAQRIEVFFDRVTADPIGTLESIYEKAGIELVPAERTNIQRYTAENSRSRGPVVKYDLEEDFDVTAAEIRDRFRFYFEVLPIKTEV